MLSWCTWAKQPLIERWRQRIARRLLLAEAVVYLLAACLALNVIPFHRLTWLFERPAKQPELDGADRARTRKEVQWAIKTMFYRLPNQTTCFSRAIAAQAMLRQRGVSTTLYYGATTLPGCGLTAHVWVQDGNEGVVGHVLARPEDYHVLARYPGARDDSNSRVVAESNAHLG